MPTPLDWLRDQLRDYRFTARGVFRPVGPESRWPVAAATPEELEQRLAAGGHLLPLPKESAALANVIEVDLVDFLVARLKSLPDVEWTRGTERGYPDLEVGGAYFVGGWHAVDVKVARRADPPKRATTAPKTKSRITLYTGNTYFRLPDVQWPGVPRPFADYRSHADVIVLYTLSDRPHRVDDLEIVVWPPWKIASRERSSTTREYIGAVEELDRLRAGNGEFDTETEFYRYWRAYRFNTSKGMQRRLDAELRRLRAAQGGGAP